MIRVSILHETNLVCNAMATVLGNESDIHVVGMASTYDEAIALVHSTPCDVLLVNAHRPSQEVLHFLHRVAHEAKQTKVLVMGVIEAEEFILQCFQAGASGYALRTDSIEEMVKKVRAVYAGKSLLSPQIACALVSRVAELSQCVSMECMAEGDDLQLLCSDLTPREREVLCYLERGASNQEIAEALTIEVGTVKNHVHSILKKLNVDNRKRAAVLARQFMDISDHAVEEPRQLWQSYPMYSAPSRSQNQGYSNRS